jgi:hypothetical protein
MRAWASRGERKTGKLRENSKVMANRNPVMTNRKKGHDNLENPPSPSALSTIDGIVGFLAEHLFQPQL